MNVNIDVKVAARRLVKLVKQNGGSLKHGHALEEVAKMCGFDSYRALEASSSPEKAKTGASRTPLFERCIHDWAYADEMCMGADGQLPLSELQKRPFDIVIEEEGSGNQFRIMMRPHGANPDNLEGMDVLDMMLEINDGVPCVHLTNDPVGDMCCTVFATREGLILREDESILEHKTHATGFLKQMFATTTLNTDRAYFFKHDTAEIYAQ